MARSMADQRLGPQAKKTAGEDLADLDEPLGGAHQVGIEGVVQGAIFAATVARRISLPG
jgi:hypothetical protein